MEFLGMILVLTIIIGFLYLIGIIVETNQIAKRNYEKLDYVIKLLEKQNINTSEEHTDNE